MRLFKSRRQKFFIIGTGLIVKALFALVLFNQTNLFTPAAVYNPLDAEQIKKQDSAMVVASCPTWYYLLELLESHDFEVIGTNSTAESLYLLENNIADFILAGRALKPEEPQLLGEIIGHGYSFIADKEMVITEADMWDYNFFTDQDKQEILQYFPNIKLEKITEVEDVYNYLEQGIVITSIGNTDYSRSEMVHVFGENGLRYRFSRTPKIYYHDFLEDETLLLVKSITSEIEDYFLSTVD